MLYGIIYIEYKNKKNWFTTLKVKPGNAFSLDRIVRKGRMKIQYLLIELEWLHLVCKTTFIKCYPLDLVYFLKAHALKALSLLWLEAVFLGGISTLSYPWYFCTLQSEINFLNYWLPMMRFYLTVEGQCSSSVLLTFAEVLITLKRNFPWSFRAVGLIVDFWQV